MRIDRQTALLVACLLAAGTATAQQQPAPSADVNPVVLTVNGEPVHAAEISLVMQTVRGHVDRQGGQASDQQVMDVATQRVIEQKLLAQEARRFGLQPEEQRVSQLLELTIRQAGGLEALETQLAVGGSSLAQVEEMFREMELGRAFIAKQIQPTVSVGDDELAAFYEANQERFKHDEQVHARHILIEVPPGADNATELDARRRADQARQRALAGEDFAALARELSEGPSAPNGGDLGFFDRKAMLEPFAGAAFALAPGEVSEVVRTRFGFHVIKSEERRPAGGTPLDEAAPELRSMLAAEKTSARVAELLQTLSAQAEIEILLEDGRAPGSSDASEPK